MVFGYIRISIYILLRIVQNLFLIIALISKLVVHVHNLSVTLYQAGAGVHVEH